MPLVDKNRNLLTVGLAQIAPVWLNRDATLTKVIAYVKLAAQQDCQLVVFGESLVPGYPFWLELTGGAQFNSPLQKTIFAEYAAQAVDLDAGHLDALCKTAADCHTAVYLGCVERPADRGGHSLYCSLVFIDEAGEIRSVHRKLIPTYEERLVWGSGDGHGLQTHALEGFRAGGLICWENWMPLARSALYAQGEDLHVAVWPGSKRNTGDITRFMAMESRSYVVSVSGLMRREDVGAGAEWREIMRANSPDVLASGGSCVGGPDGDWLLPPANGEERLFVVTLDHGHVLRERQNFDPSGHYARPDITRLELNRERQAILAQSSNKK